MRHSVIVPLLYYVPFCHFDIMFTRHYGLHH